MCLESDGVINNPYDLTIAFFIFFKFGLGQDFSKTSFKKFNLKRGAMVGRPWAHWNGKSHFARSDMIFSQVCKEILSPNLIAPWQA